ncbi:cryptochrome/deoxyribodipyrimidine photo-lyase family protein [Seonamhaeicola sp. ML3]|uniref:cryptochrome/deoxyribodipyrimidine photo-lyase family protein n=1 Tax=Seonamhaeicola sp. ML3 TaxID=2937786 RepID=UPI00200C0795|nr:deoxyribodipyrimidine photo-lyase [Seonamhaeicola sp. ML3]
MIEKEHINVVWLKRDLRLFDNEAIYEALKSERRVLLLYCFEPILVEDVHYSERHWNFIKESITDLNEQLAPYQSKILAVNADINATINQLLTRYRITEIFSHQETGILVTYERDKNFKRFCKNNLIDWKEYINNGVIRGLKDRKGWNELVDALYAIEPLPFQPKSNQLISLDTIKSIEENFKLPQLKTSEFTPFQKGGRTTGLRYLNSFFQERHKDYMFHISKPDLARTSCSRISPYIAWGNLSVREVIHKTKETRKVSKHKKALDAFMSRLRWQSHFIQKFEMEHTMEEASINKGFHKLKKNISESYQIAWKKGQTGYPLVDACMRCLNETGYLNFRMRALVVSFFTHNLWQPWQAATTHLSQMFLDFEPGIHFPQLQMQAGETGINMLRIYNPVKNSLEHDPSAAFIKKWVPELRDLDTPFAHQPYLMTELEQQFYNITLGEDYPLPIVDLEATRKKAGDTLWNLRKDKTVMEESQRILRKHTLKNRRKQS